MIHGYIRLAVARTAGKGWVEDCKKRFSPDLRTSALYKLGLVHRDNINAMKQNGLVTCNSLLATGVSSSRISRQDTTDPCTFGKAAKIGVRLLTCSNSYRSTTLTWCNFMGFLEKGICPPFCYHDKGHMCFQLCSARCISRARPKP